MIILHLITDLDYGGAERVLFRICSETKKFKIQNKIISLKSDGKLLENFKQQGIEVIEFDFKKNLLDIFQFIKLVKTIITLRPKILMTWLYHADFLGLVLYFISFKSFKLIWNIRCSNIFFSNYSIITKYIFNILIFFSYIPHTITFNSYSGYNYHIKKGYKPRNKLIISNFLDTKIWKFDEEMKLKLKKKLKIDSKKIVIANIGRYDPQKDHKTFLKSAEMIVKKNFKVIFLIVGKDVKKMKLKNQLKNNSIVLDNQNNIREILNCVDILVLSSLYGEGFSNIVLESMAMSIPCVVSDVGDSAKIVGRSGEVFKPGDYFDLYNKIIKLLSDDASIIKKRKILARDLVEKNYESKIVIKSIINLWEKIN